MPDSLMRKQWQAFKKAHPEFEKERKSKLDWGPTMDKLESARKTYESAQKALAAKQAALTKAYQAYEAAWSALSDAEDKNEKTRENLWATVRDDYQKIYMQGRYKQHRDFISRQFINAHSKKGVFSDFGFNPFK